MPRKRKVDLQEVALRDDAPVAEQAEVASTEVAPTEETPVEETPEVAPAEVSLSEETPIGDASDVAPVEEAPIDNTPEVVIAEVAPTGETPVDNASDDTQNVVRGVNLKEPSVEKTPIKELKTSRPVAKSPAPLKAKNEGRRPKNQLRFVR
jgi:hypothetical protein